MVLPPPTRLLRPFPLLVAVSLPLLSGCGSEAAEPYDAPPLVVTPLASPAGPHSGEPSLSALEGGAVLTWLHSPDEGGTALRAARYAGDGSWEPLPDLVRSDSLLVNWADFPAVTSLGGDRLAAHWLVLGPAGGLDYGVRIAVSDDGGRSWGDPWTPHEDGLPVEHGFVSVFPTDEGARLVWLDGRRYHTSEDGPMELRSRAFADAGLDGPEQVVDSRVCDCCQTGAAATDSGAVVVYRDRTEGEIRDIRAARLGPEGWEEPTLVHDDGWEIGGCPVNGPAAAFRDGWTAVAWFTGAGDEPVVRLAYSRDRGRTFEEPIRVDGGRPAGRVDVELLREGTAVVSWIERAEGEGSLMVRTVTPDGALGEPIRAARPGAGRSAGFPRMAALGDGEILLAWTVPADPSVVELARVRMDGGR